MNWLFDYLVIYGKKELICKNTRKVLFFKGQIKMTLSFHIFPMLDFCLTGSKFEGRKMIDFASKAANILTL